MKKIRLAFLASIAFFLLAAPSFAEDVDSFSGKKGQIKIAGGTAHIPVMKIAAQQIMTSNPDIRITIAGGGSGVGIKQVGEGMIDIGNAGRKATEKEIEAYGLHMVKWAIDGVGVVVNPQNEVTALSSVQLQAVFSGEVKNWKDLGGEDKTITLYNRDAASGTRAVFWKKALKKGKVSETANVVVSNGAMKTSVAGDPNGIGYVSVGHIDSTVSPVALDGVAPSLKNVKNGSYGVARGLYSMTKGEPAGLAKLVLDYLLSPSGQKIAMEKGFISVK